MATKQFEKHFTPNDITSEFSVPIAWLDAMPEFGEGRQEVLLRAVDGVGFGWQFICAVRKGRYKKPVLNLAEWGRLVSAKSLKAGDKIIFYKEENEFIFYKEENEFRGSQYQFRAQKLDAYGNWVDV